MRRKREPAHEIRLLVQREKEDREHGVDRQHREERQLRLEPGWRWNFAKARTAAREAYFLELATELARTSPLPLAAPSAEWQLVARTPHPTCTKFWLMSIQLGWSDAQTPPSGSRAPARQTAPMQTEDAPQS